MEWKPEFDEAVAESLIGKYVLVGITDFEGDTEKVLGYRQLHGRIVTADKRGGVVVRNPTTHEEFTLPPITNHFERAAPGEYRLKASGEVVANPDFLCTWSIYSNGGTREGSAR